MLLWRTQMSRLDELTSILSILYAYIFMFNLVQVQSLLSHEPDVGRDHRY